MLYLIASGKPDWVPGGFASNGYGDLSPGKYNLTSCFLIEALGTFFFLYVIIGTTSKGAAVGFAGIPIGLCLTLIHLVLSPSPTRRSIRRAAPDRRCLPAAPLHLAAVAVLAGADHRRSHCRSDRPLAARGA